MSRWLVNVRGQQFSATTMEDLRKLGREGTLTAGDIVQPPGASDWLYALEVPELKNVLRTDSYEDFGNGGGSSGLSTPVKVVLGAGLALVAVVAWAYAYNLSQTIPEPEDLQLIGAKGMSYSEVLVTANPAQLFAEAGGGAAVGTLPKDTNASLLGKRGEWYRLRANGIEGYARITDVVPAYLFGDEKVQEQYKPLYYPDQYAMVRNSSWTMLPDQAKQNITVFNFMLGNDSPYAMTDVKLLAIIKDATGKVLEQHEIPVEGPIPAQYDTMVGMLKADPKDKTSVDRVMTSAMFEELMKTNPELNERWMDGVEVHQQSDGFSGAEIRIAEVRAVPPETMPK